MDRTFYQFILTYTDPNKQDKQTQFANIVANDIGFPKHTTHYQDIVHYIELTDLYSSYVSIFDELWDVYVELTCYK